MDDTNQLTDFGHCTVKKNRSPVLTADKHILLRKTDNVSNGDIDDDDGDGGGDSSVDGNRNFLEPKIPLQSRSLHASESVASMTVQNEEITLKMCDNTMQNTLLSHLNTFRRNRELCDVVLFVHEKEILAHKIVLAACSPALMDMFVRREIGDRCSKSLHTAMTLPTADSISPTLAAMPITNQPFSYYEFAEADYDCFEAIVNYAYSSNLEISSKKVGVLYKTACALQVTPIARACAHYLIENLNIVDCIAIRRQAVINDDVLVEQVDNFIAKNFAQVVESPEFTHLPLVKVRLILNTEDTKELSHGEDIALRVIQYFQSLPHINDRAEQWIEQLVEKTHMLYIETDNRLQDCMEMDDHSSVGASDIIQDYKHTGGYLPRTYSGSRVLEIRTPAQHFPGATQVHLNSSRSNNTKLSSAESNSSLSSTAESDDESYKLIAVHQTAEDFWITLAMFHRCLVALSIQISEAENVIKQCMTSEVSRFVPAFETKQQQKTEKETVVRLVSSEGGSRIPLPQMESPRCSVGGVFIDGKIIVCGGYDRGKCLESVEEYNVLEGNWRRLADMAQCRGRFDAAVVGSRVYAVAGSSGSVDLKTVECYDSQIERWSLVKSLNHGRSHNDEWLPIAPLRTARFQAGCTSWHGLVIVCGGCNGWKCLDSVDAYNPKTGKWQKLASLKTARRGSAVAVIKDSLFVIGGHDGTHSLNSVEILDDPAGEWRSGPSLTIPRANVKAVVASGDEIYLLGGFDGTQFLSSIEMLNSGSIHSGTNFCFI